MPGQLAGGRGLARSLQAGHQDHGRRAVGHRQLGAGLAHQLGQLLVDDLHHLLAGRQAVEHVRSHRPLLDAGDEILDDAEVDVGLEQREPDLAHRLVDVVLAQPALAAEAVERRAQPV
jgi:hypothetical protein